jgi:hypothetical protein
MDSNHFRFYPSNICLSTIRNSRIPEVSHETLRQKEAKNFLQYFRGLCYTVEEKLDETEK